MILKVGIKYLTLFLVLICSKAAAYGQIENGRIVFERKTNLIKRFGSDDRMKRMFNEQNKTKVDKFELLFNDTCSVFKPIYSDEPDNFSWATNRNTVYQNFNQKNKLSVLDLWGNSVYVKDSVSIRQWQVTDSKRKIGKYMCRKAVWQKDDTTRIYAWFTTEIISSVGPETFCGLPGAILGLATEDGGVIYFATKIEEMVPTQKQLTYQLGKNEVYTMEQLKTELEKQFGDKPWGKRLFIDLFRWQ
jgi:GLPGLI family protein